MASSKQVLLLMAAVVAAVACLASMASATQWVVGNGCGWKDKFNETCWADGKKFVVGDTLLFNYAKGEHNVVQVGEEEFETCKPDADDSRLGAWCSGHDVVRLDKPGKMWFICTKCDHCLKGMKLAINVVDDVAPPPPPPLIRFPFPPGTSPPPPPPPFRTPPPPPFRWPGTPPPPPSRWRGAPPPPPPRSAAAVTNLVGGAVAAAAAAVLAAALAF